MVQRYEQTRKLQWYKRGAAYNTLALGYVFPAIRAYSGLAPVRQCSCRAYYDKREVPKGTSLFYA